MDSENNVEKRIGEIIAKHEANSEDVSWEEMREIARLTTEKTLSMFEEMIKSRWNRGNQKFNLQVFHALMSISGKTSEDMLAVFEHIHNLTKAIYILSSKMEKNSEATAILETTLGQLKAKLASPKFERIDQFLEHVDKSIIEKSEKSKVRDKYTV